MTRYLGDCRMTRFVDRGLVYALVMAALGAHVGVAAGGPAGEGQKNPPAAGVAKTAQEKASPDRAAQDKTSPAKYEGLVIEPGELPGTYPHGPYQVNFHARGNYVPVLHWSVEKGALPPGITLDDNGVLRGEAERAGEFQFVVAG